MKKYFTLLLAVLMVLSLLPFTDISVAAEEDGVIITPTAENCVEFYGWTGSSGLKRYDGKTTAPTGGGTAIFEVPEALDGWVDVYYYIPEYSLGYTATISCGVGLIVNVGDEREIKLSVLVTDGNGGYWERAGSEHRKRSLLRYDNISL